MYPFRKVGNLVPTLVHLNKPKCAFIPEELPIDNRWILVHKELNDTTLRKKVYHFEKANCIRLHIIIVPWLFTFCPH